MMKTTVLYASFQTAQRLSKEFLELKDESGKPQFKRKKIEFGFEILRAASENEDVVFRYVNMRGLKRIDYDEELVSFQ